ncbi:methyltransferase [Candidatus Woesearchaeota archaeon]|nr:methyltransferase [Candidatus Woesearchaeota archaeon]
MIEQAPEHLKTGAAFWLVCRHQIGGKMFEKKMDEVFGNVETISRQSGYRVYRSKKN